MGPGRGLLDPDFVRDADAVVCLSGAGVGDHRWTDSYKRQIVQSRVDSVGTVVRALAELPPSRRPARADRGVGGRLLRRHAATGSSTRIGAAGDGSWPSCASSGKPRPTRRGAPASGSRILRTGLVLSATRRRCSSGWSRWSRPASAAGSAAGSSTWPGSRWPTRSAAIRLPARDRRRLRAGEPHRAGAGAQCRVHRRRSAGAAPADRRSRRPAFAAGWRSASSPRGRAGRTAGHPERADRTRASGSTHSTLDACAGPARARPDRRCRPLGPMRGDPDAGRCRTSSSRSRRRTGAGRAARGGRRTSASTAPAVAVTVSIAPRAGRRPPARTPE